MRMMIAAVILAASMISLNTAISAAEIVKVDNYNISINFSDLQVELLPLNNYMVGELNITPVEFSSATVNGSIAIGESLVQEPHSILVSNCKRVLELILKQSNFNVDVTPYEDGFIGTGEDLATGSTTYAILKPDDVEFGRASRLLIVMAASENEEMSKSIISSATPA